MACSFRSLASAAALSHAPELVISNLAASATRSTNVAGQTKDMRASKPGTRVPLIKASSLSWIGW
jgi:hypothetical protein